MKEFIEKLIGRLEERINENKKYTSTPLGNDAKNQIIGMKKAIKIANQLAEEYKEQNNDQDLMIVASLPSLYPMMQPFEVEAIHRVLGRAKDNNGWIPCSEKLPEEKGDYLVTCNDGKVRVWWFVVGEDFKCWRIGVHTLKPIAWQPLPEPFKPKGE